MKAENSPDSNYGSLHNREALLANVAILAAFALRVWRLDAKGFAYDESATALMSRASIAEIVHFHWAAAYEHLPLVPAAPQGEKVLQAGSSGVEVRRIVG